MRTSLHTALRAGSIVSPARSTDTPVICGVEARNKCHYRTRPPKDTLDRALSPLSRCNGGPRIRDPVASEPHTSARQDGQKKDIYSK